MISWAGRLPEHRIPQMGVGLLVAFFLERKGGRVPS